MSWQQTTVRKLRAGPPPSLGQDAISKRTGKEKRIPRAVIEQGARLAQHARCVDHVEVAGLTTPVCITRGADRKQLLADARELAGLTE